MVEHADLLDTSLLHEPKGIKESESGEVYISTVTNTVSGPFTGEWRKVKVSDLDITTQSVNTPTYSGQSTAVTLSNSIPGTALGSVSSASSFTQTNQNDLELFTAVANLLTRVSQLEDTVSKNKTLLGSINSGLKTLGLFQELS